MYNNYLPIESIQERDIDLLLLEEFNCNKDFIQWFILINNLPLLKELDGAWRSISLNDMGETDILLTYITNDDKKVFVLIENKLDASFQYNQGKRYLIREKKYINDGECDVAFSLLIAPLSYCNNQNEFNQYLTYESILAWFNSIRDVRSKFKAQLFEIAITKARRGYTPINSSVVQSFWFNYWIFINNNFQELNMDEPKVVPYNSDWISIRTNKLKKIVFYHKLSNGCIDAHITRFDSGEVQPLMDKLPNWIDFKEHKKSFSLSIKVPVISRLKPFESQETLIEKSLINLIELIKFIRELNISKFK